MSNFLTEGLGDDTSKSTTPDFESGRGYYWMKQMKALQALPENERPKNWPKSPRRGLAEESFFGAVDRRLSRSTFGVSVTFDKDGKVIRQRRSIT